MSSEQKSVTEASVTQLSQWVWEEKYRYYEPDGTSKEERIYDTHRRVIEGVYAKDQFASKYKPQAIELMDSLIWCPAGRIHANAGTPKRVTSINCFVSPNIQDSLSDVLTDESGLPIMKALEVAAITQQMGGGIGMDFSPLRPSMAVIRRTGSMSMGPLPWMGMWDAMCAGIKSSGHRRGAMMGVMRIDHPDILKFVKAKHEKGVLENFNVSVLVPHAFMQALKNDENWMLGFHVPRADGIHVDVIDTKDGPWYVYEIVKANELWDEIIRSTFEFAEPGIIFIDRVNEMNNLQYCEYIHACNPCGEQPLPPNGDCNLGAVNLAKMVKEPFTKRAYFDFDLLRNAVRAGVRFLDNVLDTSLFPTEAQREEALAKRRIGLGITGLGNMLQMMMLRYGGADSIRFIDILWTTIRDTAYETSIELAKERGAFPLFDRDKYCATPFIKSLPEHIQKGVYEHGIRNAVLLTIAPTGTTSMYYENVSSGIEPTIAWTFKRKMREADGSYKEVREISDYGFELFKKVTGWKKSYPLPDYMCSALEEPNIVTVDEHLAVQAVCQKYIDASISKTINCPVNIPYEDFKEVYTKAYDLGLKGCTTYKPSAVRGSVISVDEAEKPATTLKEITVEPRPDELVGYTYKVKYPGIEHAFYVTINDIQYEDGRRQPFEIFINSKSITHQEWIVALTRMISAIFRRGGDVTFIVEELQQVFSARGGAFVNRKFVPSIVALIGNIVEKHFIKIGLLDLGGMLVPEELVPAVKELISKADDVLEMLNGETCPNCQAPTYFKQEGCYKCTSCFYSSCG